MKDPCLSPWCFLYLRETYSCGGEGGEEGGDGEKSQSEDPHSARGMGNKMAYTARGTFAPPWGFLCLRETQSWRCGEEEGEGEKVHLKTHATARGVCKKKKYVCVKTNDLSGGTIGKTKYMLLPNVYRISAFLC